jgi:hypothetical protein
MGYAGPVRARLVPPVVAAVPEGMTRIDQPLTLGVPQRIPLDDQLELALVVPTGLAVEWRDGEPTAELSSSASERVPHIPAPTSPVGELRRPPARLLLLDGGQLAGVVPLVAGSVRRVPSGGEAEVAVRAEVAVIDWDLRSAALRGPGDSLSRVTLAWRRADRAVDQFSTPLVPRKVVIRLKPEQRMESDLGLRRAVLHNWSKAKFEVLR